MQSFEIRKDETSEADYGYQMDFDATTNILKCHIWDDMGSDFWFSRLLPYPSRKTIYVTEVYGYSYDNDPQREYDITTKSKLRILTKIGEIVLAKDDMKEYTAFEPISALTTEIAAQKNFISQQFVPLTTLFTRDINEVIATFMVPPFLKTTIPTYPLSLKEHHGITDPYSTEGYDRTYVIFAASMVHPIP